MIKLQNNFFIIIVLCLSVVYTKAQSVSNVSDLNETEYNLLTPVDSTIQKMLDEVSVRFSHCLCSQGDIPLYGVIVDRADEISFSLHQGPYPKKEDGFTRQVVEKDGLFFFFPFSSDYYHFQNKDKRISLSFSEEQNVPIPYISSPTWSNNRDHMTLLFKNTDNQWREYSIHHCVYAENEISSAQIGQLCPSHALSLTSPYVPSETTGCAVLYVKLNKEHSLTVTEVTDMIYLRIHNPYTEGDIYYFDDDYCSREEAQYQYYYSIILQILDSVKCKIKRHPRMDGTSNVNFSNKVFRKKLSDREPLFIRFKVTPMPK